MYIILIPAVIFGSALIPRIGHLLGDTLLIISILLILMLHLINITRQDKRYIRTTPLDLPILLFIFFVIVSLVRSLNFYDSLMETLKVSAYVILFFIIVQYKDNQRLAKVIIRSILLTGLFVSLYGIYEHITGVGIFRYPHQMVFSTFPNPNHFGGYMVITLTLALSLILFNNVNKKEKIALLTIIIASSFGLYSARSKGAFLSLLGALFVIATLKGKKYLKIYAALVICVVIIVISLLTPVGRSFVLSGFMSDPYSYERIPLWRETLHYISDYPILGTGIGTFKDYYPQYKSMPGLRSAAFSHNEFLNIWAELGVFALVVFGWILVVFFKESIYLIKQTERKYKGIFSGILTASAGIIIHSLVEFNLHTPGIAIAFLSMIAIVTSFSSSDKEKDKKLFTPAPMSIGAVLWTKFSNENFGLKKSKNLLITFIVLGFIGLSVFLSMPLIADYYFNKGNVYAENKDYLKAISNYEKAVKFNPLFTHYRERLADTYLMEGEILKDENFIFGAYYEYNKCVKFYPRNVFYRLKLARFYVKSGALDKALEEYKEIIKLAPNVQAFREEYEEVYKNSR